MEYSSSAGRSNAKNVEVKLSQMIHKASIELDSINTFKPIIRYLSFSGLAVSSMKPPQLLSAPALCKLNLQN